MKKALALVLALVLALSLSVSAFAALSLVELKPASSSSTDKIKVTELTAEVDDNVYYLLAGEGGTYYVKLADLEDGKKYKDVTVSATGAVAAEVVDYDPAKFEDIDEVRYYIYDTLENEAVLVDDMGGILYATQSAKTAKTVAVLNAAGTAYETIIPGYYQNGSEISYVSAKAFKVDDKTVKFDNVAYNADSANAVLPPEAKANKVKVGDAVKVVDYRTVDGDYADMKAIAGILNEAARSDRYVVKTSNETTLIKITVEDNYSAAYKTGAVKVSAVVVDGRKKTNVSQTLNVIRDVSIFEYNLVKWAGANDEALVVGAEDGYSDYLTSGVYADKDGDYNETALRKYAATVVSTTAFRALREAKDGLSVEAGAVLVEIDEIGAGQKGVNFAFDQGNDFNRVNANGIVKVYDAAYLKKGLKVPESLDFGFLGDQAIASDFNVVVDLGMTAFELREFFEEKVEEEDIITYYILKDGKEFSTLTIDYMTLKVNGVAVDFNEELEIEIEGKAGDTLGHYSIVMNAPAAPEAPEGEENPNTGAESVIGVVAAMAVVSVAAAAAVSLKK